MRKITPMTSGHKDDIIFDPKCRAKVHEVRHMPMPDRRFLKGKLFFENFNLDLTKIEIF